MEILLVQVSREESRLGSDTYLVTYRHDLPSPEVVRGRGVKGGGGQSVEHAGKGSVTTLHIKTTACGRDSPLYV